MQISAFWMITQVRDFWTFLWLKHDSGIEGDYFDLRLVSERYTGYSGKDAHNVWGAIYEENCFGISELTLVKAKSPAAVSLPDTTVEVLRNGEQEIDSQCLERRVYYKIISGVPIDFKYISILIKDQVFMHQFQFMSVVNI